ncbi:MAG: alkaline phosphatase D family protein [Planctomycetes bacterium]|nr:alkaline phosphatase D family protein [Planctomycetota bacterium]
MSLFLVSIVILGSPDASGSASRQATGVKVGEVSPDSAIVWMRVTANAARIRDGILRRGRPAKVLPPEVAVDALEGACPGAPGEVRLRYGTREDLDGARSTDWVPVGAATDFAHAFRLTGLAPGTLYHVSAETRGPGGGAAHEPLRGSFRTAPPPDARADVRFTVVTGQAYADVDHADGFHIYDAMAKLAPSFIVLTGDTVYYDNEDPRATTPAVARYHWHRMYGFPRHIALHLRVPGYWMKDDHDTLSDDCWPGQDRAFMRPMTFEEGRRIFLQEVPMGERTFRRARWGKALEVWFVEGRDFRSPNDMRDGPEKTIWGAEQLRWLKETLAASDADWRILASPTPIVGPDRKAKADNHANAAFAREGKAFRAWAAKELGANFFIVCGDRHWQYHSVDPGTGLVEWSCGPASDEHAGGSPGLDEDYHRFHRVKGGFLSVSVMRAGARSAIAFRFHDVKGGVVYEKEYGR